MIGGLSLGSPRIGLQSMENNTSLSFNSKKASFNSKFGHSSELALSLFGYKNYQNFSSQMQQQSLLEKNPTPETTRE